MCYVVNYKNVEFNTENIISDTRFNNYNKNKYNLRIKVC